MPNASAGCLPAADPAPPQAPLVAEILEVVRERRGVDFRDYRAATVARRIRNRMLAAGVQTMEAYLDRLRGEPCEADRLLERLTIKVSRFFRGAPDARAVRDALAERAALPGPLSAWSAGCGRGEEAYTLAILLAELGRLDVGAGVLGTDLDASALEAARAGAYPEEALVEVPPPVRARWFEGPDGRGTYRVSPELRRCVDLVEHDLAGPFPSPGRRFELVACRNTLIYFAPALQARVLARLCDALAPGGLLWLGEAEWPMGEAGERLRVVHRSARLFALAGGEGGLA